MPKLEIDFNSHDLMVRHSHGLHQKDLLVLHETVSKDIPGLGDIMSIELYLASKDYGIHGMTDSEGHIAWARGLGSAIFWHCGGVNERSVGIEQVSNVMLRSPSNVVRKKIWVARNKQLRATAKLIAAWHNADPKNRPIRYTDGKPAHSGGVTSHWDISQWSPSSQGHTDCWPAHKEGYYPILEVIQLAKIYAVAGVHF